LNANKHNHITTSYYLLLKRYQDLGQINQSDFIFFDDKAIIKLIKEQNANEKKMNDSITIPQSVPSTEPRRSTKRNSKMSIVEDQPQPSKTVSEVHQNQASVNQSMVEQQVPVIEEQKYDSIKQKVMNSTLPIAPKKSLEDSRIEDK